MTYFEGFLVPVPADRRDAYRDAAGRIADFLRANGAQRVVEAWGDGLEHGKTTDFYRAVDATEGENVVFSWAEWPSRAVRDAAGAKMRESPPIDPARDGPFDGRRVVFGGFEPLLVERARANGVAPTYVDGFVIPVPGAGREDYRRMAAAAAPIFLEHGALRVVEAWGEDVAHGHTTDFYRAVKAESGEEIVFSWIEWPSKAARDAGNAKVMADDRMHMHDMAFNPQRMFWGGFETTVDEGGE